MKNSIKHIKNINIHHQNDNRVKISDLKYKNKIKNKGEGMSLDSINRAEVIAAYENKRNLPEVIRYTEYKEKDDCYVLKLGIGEQFIQKRYEEALQPFQEEKEKRGNLVGVLEITLEHNMKDVGIYSIDNSRQMIMDFFTNKRRIKRVGVQYQKKEPIYLLFGDSKKEYPTFIDLSFDGLSDKQLKELEHYRCEWFIWYVQLKQQAIIEETQNIIHKATSNLSPKQSPFHYEKEIKKRMEQNKKIFLNKRMEDFDFRRVDLSGAIFIQCVLCNANFAHVNLCDTLFINCDLQGAVYLGATLNNSFQIQGECKPLIDVYKEYGGGNERTI